MATTNKRTIAQQTLSPDPMPQQANADTGATAPASSTTTTQQPAPTAPTSTPATSAPTTAQTETQKPKNSEIDFDDVVIRRPDTKPATTPVLGAPTTTAKPSTTAGTNTTPPPVPLVGSGYKSFDPSSWPEMMGIAPEEKPAAKYDRIEADGTPHSLVADQPSWDETHDPTAYNGYKAKPEQPGKPASDEADPYAYEPLDSYKKMVDYFKKAAEANRPETKEERAERKKKEKRQALFSAIGDGISALSNLYFTTQYAPNVEQHPLSEKAQERFDKMTKEREDRDARFFAYLNSLYGLESGERSWKKQLQLARDKAAQQAIENARADKKMEWAQERQDLNLKLQLGKIDEQTYNTEKARIDAKYAPQVYQDKHNTAVSTQNKNNAAANNSNAHAAHVGDSGSGGKGKWTFLGVTYSSKDDYERAVRKYAQENNIPVTSKKNTTKNDGFMSSTTSTDVNRPINDIAAEGERHYAKNNHKSSSTSKGKKGGYSAVGRSNGKKSAGI